jgi:hypothetical protein
MKNIFLIILFGAILSCKAQTFPLRTYTDIPENAYLKDTNNELQDYVGTWKGTWGDRIIYINFKKSINIYNELLKYYKDNLIGRFKVTDLSGNILFDNMALPDGKVKIQGGKFRKIDDKYSLAYVDSDLCDTSGNIIINFTDPSKTQLNWKYNEGSNMITTDCQYYNTTTFPTALPKDIVLIKQ